MYFNNAYHTIVPAWFVLTILAGLTVLVLVSGFVVVRDVGRRLGDWAFRTIFAAIAAFFLFGAALLCLPTHGVEVALSSSPDSTVDGRSWTWDCDSEDVASVLRANGVVIVSAGDLCTSLDKPVGFDESGKLVSVALTGPATAKGQAFELVY